LEFALVVPILFLLIWGGMNFSRAYQRLNVLTGSLREGARYGATLNPVDQALIRTKVATYSAAFGFPIDANQVTAVLNVEAVEVSVTNYALFTDLTGFGVLDAITVTRKAIFRWERS
jgi:Flp pilus assembly protein TadG